MVGSIVPNATAPSAGLIRKMRTVVATSETTMSTLRSRQAKRKSCNRQMSVVAREMSSPELARSW